MSATAPSAAVAPTPSAYCVFQLWGSGLRVEGSKLRVKGLRFGV
jgi:hypothetical protein